MALVHEFMENVVVSTRIRLARNFAGFPFPRKMDLTQSQAVAYLVEEELRHLDEFEKYELCRLDEREKALLQEQYLISPALIKSRHGVAFVSADRNISIMVNEEDHLRQQYICKGFDLYKAYERIGAIDEGLSSVFDFAFDEKLGYLTACPSNLGTGMRASVMMFLPALAKSGELKTILPELKADGITVRGAFGEGTMAEGYLYQVSNERTLGVSEMQILDDMIRRTMLLCDMEMQARENLLRGENAILTKDTCLRAYGTLTNCATLSLKELREKIAEVRLGHALGFFDSLDKKGLEEFMDDMRPATFIHSNGLEKATEKEQDVVRAETVCNALPELLRVAKKKKR